MATHANSTPAPSIATALSVQTNLVSQMKMAGIQNVANTLASMMEDMHGGTWRAVVDHGASTSFVLIRPNNDKPDRPKRREAV